MNYSSENPFKPKKLAKIKVAAPYPLLDPGDYIAECTTATYDWSNHFKAWKAILTLEPLNYTGRAYSGKLCKFLGLGKQQERPYAGPRSDFRKLLVEVNGAQPSSQDADLSLFVGCKFLITVETVTKDRKNEALSPEHHYSIVRRLRPLKPSELFNVSNQENSKNSGNLLTDQPSNLGNLPLGKRQSSGLRNNDFG